MFRFDVSFRIEHPSLDPAEVSAALSLTPGRSWKAGDPRTNPSGALLEGTCRSSYWSYRLEGEPGATLPEALSAFTDRLEQHRQFLEKVHGTGGRLEYFVGWYSEASSGEVFSHELMAKLTALHIDLALDVYC